MSSHRLPRERCQASAPVSVDPTEPQRCCICLDACCTSTRDENAEVPVQLPCGHVFGNVCITKWMQTKRTCPLCRFELFDVELDNDDGHNIQIHEHDSGVQRSGISSAHIFIFSFVSGFPEERITVSSPCLSAAHSSTAAHRSFGTRLGGCLSAPPQYARQSYRPDAQMGRRYGHDKTLSSYFESEDIWITALIDERDELALAAVGDDWITALNEDLDEADEMELHRQLYPCAASVQQVWLEDLLPDYVYDDLLVEHMQWMHEVNEVQYDAYDVFDCPV